MKLYDNNGWINAAELIDCRQPFVLALGGRGIGKSYGILKTLYQRGTPFIYMRRTQTQIDALAVPQLNPFNQIAKDLNEIILSAKLSKHTAGFYRGTLNDKGEPVPDGPPIGIAIALSTFASIRSLSAEGYDVLFFDEIIPERHERPIKEEGLAFSNVLESLNRNRELTGRPPIKIIMVSNSNTINSSIIDAIGCIDAVDKMTRTGASYKNIDDLIAIYRYTNSPISKRKSETALYKVIKNSDFQQMALNNMFAESDYENVKSFPLIEFYPVCSFGSSTICKHKSKNLYYCVSGIKSENHYDSLPISKKAFQRKYYYIAGAIMDGKVFYQNVSVKIEIERAFK